MFVVNSCNQHHNCKRTLLLATECPGRARSTRSGRTGDDELRYSIGGWRLSRVLHFNIKGRRKQLMHLKSL
jgi:hypothetical protein